MVPRRGMALSRPHRHRHESGFLRGRASAPFLLNRTQNLPILGDGEFARAVAQFGETPHLLVRELDHLFKESGDPPGNRGRLGGAIGGERTVLDASLTISCSCVKDAPDLRRLKRPSLRDDDGFFHSAARDFDD